MSTMESLEKCVKLTVKMPERPQSLRIGVFMVNFESILRIVMAFPLLADIEQLNIEWVKPFFPDLKQDFFG